MAEIEDGNANVAKREFNIKEEDCKLLSHSRGTSLSPGWGNR